MFDRQGVDLDKLCLTQDQIIQFVINHRQHLHPYATFFLFKVGKESLVAGVFWHDARRLRVRVRRLANGYVWDAVDRPRVVLPASPELQRGEPQLTL